ncbi:MAG: ACP S-malonyltransferase [Bacteroidia bacterium]
MNAYVFPGQGAQFPGMGKDLYEQYELARNRFEEANEILGFRITDIMFEGSEEALRQTKVTQPAIFLHSVIMAELLGDHFKPQMAAGHSLGEFSALVACGSLNFADGLRLVSQRALAMQKACEMQASTMAAVLGLADEVVESVCADITEEIVVPANYNCPGQLVISGSIPGVEKASEALKAAGAIKTVMLSVGGAFHSPLMEPARVELEAAIKAVDFKAPCCPIYQNVTAAAVTNPSEIQLNLIQQLTGAVRWTQSMQQMIADGASSFTEVGPGKVLQGLLRKVDRQMPATSAQIA